MQTILRLAQLFTMTVWVGGLIFFAFILAPTAFHTLPTVQLAGSVVGAALKVFDPVALAAGAIFLVATGVMFKRAEQTIRGRYEMQFLIAAVMMLGTAYIHWNLLPAMDNDRARAGGEINSVAIDHPARVHFDKLHKRSEVVEGAILLAGLLIVSLMARELPGSTREATATERSA